MFAGLEHKKFDIVCANLPYVPDGMVTSLEITKEPALALFSGNDGLDHYRRLFTEIHTLQPTYLLIEALESQHAELKKLGHEAQYLLTKTTDLVLLFTRD
jgi:release factor glutamine methyltransferase